MTAITETLPDDPGTLKAMLIAERARAEREQIIKELQRHRFGRRAEKLTEDQPLLGLEEVEQIRAAVTRFITNNAAPGEDVVRLEHYDFLDGYLFRGQPFRTSTS